MDNLFSACLERTVYQCSWTSSSGSLKWVYIDDFFRRTFTWTLRGVVRGGQRENFSVPLSLPNLKYIFTYRSWLRITSQLNLPGKNVFAYNLKNFKYSILIRLYQCSFQTFNYYYYFKFHRDKKGNWYNNKISIKDSTSINIITSVIRAINSVNREINSVHKEIYSLNSVSILFL